MPKATWGRLAEAPLWEPLLAQLLEVEREPPLARVLAAQPGLARPQPQANVPQSLNQRLCSHSPVRLDLLQQLQKTLRRRLNPIRTRRKSRCKLQAGTPIKRARHGSLRIPLRYSLCAIVE